MRKVLNIVAVILVITLIAGSVAYAAETRMAEVSLSLSFQGTTATCSCSVFKVGKYIDATFELWDGSTRVGYWTKQGTGYVSIDETASVTRGNTCTLQASGTIDGVPFTSQPVSKVCP